MLPINFLKKTLDRELGPDRWEFNNNPVGGFFTVHVLNTGHIYKVELIDDAWASHLWDGKQWVADCFLSSPLNDKEAAQ